MSFVKFLERKLTLFFRRRKLGERYTSSITDRKFATQYLSEINPSIDFNTVEYIYSIGSCNGKEPYPEKVRRLIERRRFNRLGNMFTTIDMGEDDLGLVPIGEFLHTYIWKMKNGKTFIQVIKGSYDHRGKEIILQKNIDEIKIKRIRRRKLIYPIS